MANFCRVCGGELRPLWQARVLQDRYLAQYCECTNCSCLQIPDPFWLSEAYSDKESGPLSRSDTGHFRRNFSAFSYFAALEQAGALPKDPRILDFGGGHGLLVQMLRDAGYSAWVTDKFVKEPVLARQYVRPSGVLGRSSYDVVIALEVLEHLTDPIATVRDLTRVLAKHGTLLISTGIYEPGVHDAAWHYLAREAGQHITLWSRRGLAYLARSFRYRSLAYFPSQEGFLILFSPLHSETLGPRLDEASSILARHEHRANITRNWDFQVVGVLPPETSSVVEGIEPRRFGGVRRSIADTLRRAWRSG